MVRNFPIFRLYTTVDCACRMSCRQAQLLFFRKWWGLGGGGSIRSQHGCFRQGPSLWCQCRRKVFESLAIATALPPLQAQLKLKGGCKGETQPAGFYILSITILHICRTPMAPFLRKWFGNYVGGAGAVAWARENGAGPRNRLLIHCCLRKFICRSGFGNVFVFIYFGTFLLLLNGSKAILLAPRTQMSPSRDPSGSQDQGRGSVCDEADAAQAPLFRDPEQGLSYRGHLPRPRPPRGGEGGKRKVKRKGNGIFGDAQRNGFEG